MTTYTVMVGLAHFEPDHNPEWDFRQFAILADTAADAAATGETQARRILHDGWVVSGHAVVLAPTPTPRTEATP